MENLLAGQTVSDVVDEISMDNGNLINGLIDLSCKRTIKSKKLCSSVTYIKEFNLNQVVINDELADKKVYNLAIKLAKAIDKNSVIEIKQIKQQYGSTEEFAKAKDFLNKKCKQIWDVFENKHTKMMIPQQAMRALGITNKPSLEFLLGESLRFYEKDNGSTTVNIIKSILNNPNIDYSFEEIFNYLKTMYKLEKCRYNFVTVRYLVEMVNYSEKELNLIGVDKIYIKEIFKGLSIKDKLIYLLKNFYSKISL